MAEGFGPYHVPQQTRRDKLRILSQNLDPSSFHSFLPLYASSLLPPDLLTSATPPPPSANSNAVKEETPFFTGFPYLDPNPNPNLSPNPFLYPLREFDNYGHGADQAILFKPQPVTLACRQDQSRLSLSLSSHHQGGSSSPSDQLNLPRFGTNVYAAPAFVTGSGSNEVSRSSVPLGPFTGYASVLKGSRFLKPAQQLLHEFCDVGRVMICPEKLNPGSDSSSDLMDSPMENWGDPLVDADLPPENRRKKSTLLSMLDEVYKRYKQYYQQMQAVIASFECVAGLGNAAPFANLALKSVSKYFKSLKNAITSQLSEKPYDLINRAKGGFVRHGTSDQGLPCQRSLHEHQSVWRPQRGLPERAVTVLRAWLFEHFLHPYPTDTDKLMLAKQTGLSRNQVSNWFINARVRLWKPMVEEIHMLETKQSHKSLRNDQNQDCCRSVHPSSSANSLGSENPSTSMQRVLDMTSKRCRSALPDLPESQQPLISTPYNPSSLSSPDPQVVSMARTSSGTVSLTLGLHQNNRVGFPEALPMSAAQGFGLGLEASGDEYGLGCFEPQNRHFGGGQLLHDFVG